MFAVIQLAKLGGFGPIITTASSRNESLLKSLGATHVLDRTAVPLSSLRDAVSAVTSKPIKVIYDAVGTRESFDIAYSVLARGGTLSHVHMIVGVDKEKEAADGKTTAFVYGSVHLPSQRALGVQLFKHLSAMLEAGEIKVGGAPPSTMR